jgi:hypothetical protein
MVPLGIQLIPRNAIFAANSVIPNQTLQQQQIFHLGTPAITPASPLTYD